MAQSPFDLSCLQDVKNTHTYTPNPNKVYQLFAILGMIEMLLSNLVKPVNKGHSWEQYTLAFVGSWLLSGGQFLYKLALWDSGVRPLFTSWPLFIGDR